MIHFNRKNLVFITLLLLSACADQPDLFVEYSNPHIAYSGRVDTTTAKAADLYWSGTSVTINFKGEAIGALLEDERGDNYYNIIIDNDSLFVLRPDTTKRLYPLATGLSNGNHKIEIFKRTEWDRGKTTFYGFQIKGNTELLNREAPRKRKIEFYGNSITAGYAVEDFSGKDRPDSIFTNNYLSYAAITARHFNAEYNCICKSGIGILISWFPLTMPEIYNRLIPEDSTSRWDFTLYTPDVVVVNLFQNDSWLVNMPDYETFKTQFGTKAPDEDVIVKSYAGFVSAIRKEYPNAQIICALGTMDATREGSPWPGYIQQAVAGLNDSKTVTFFMPYKNTPGHPTIAEQEDMADSLIHFIEKNVEW